jgi:6-phosphofructokinase 1
MPGKNAFYAQSGGVTAVINATACGVIETARKHRAQIANVYAGRNGIIGALTEDMIDTSKERASGVSGARHRLFLLQRRQRLDGYRPQGIPDLEEDGFPGAVPGHPEDGRQRSGPGFGSVAKYVAVSTQEAALDVLSMAKTSTKVFILEVMGRHAGWIAAAGGLAGTEVPFDKRAFLKRVRECVNRYDYCVIVVSEGARYKNGKFLAEAGTRDAFGHAQLGGVAPVVAQMVRDNLGFKYHYAVADYLQRSARHIASATDVKQAYAVGKAAVEFALQGKTAVMPVIKRVSDKPYRWRIDEAPLSRVANKEKMLPARYITKDGFGITEAARRYLQPLIRGEDYPPYVNGLPKYVELRNVSVAPQLKTKFVV